MRIPLGVWFLAVIGPLNAANAAGPGAAPREAARTFAVQLQAVTTRHLDALLAEPAKLTALKGKSAAGMTALAFELAFESSRRSGYHAAALKRAASILADLRATKFGVFYIKEKTRSTGDHGGA